MPVSPARAAAFDILLRVERESSYAAELLHSKAYQKMATADHALATELVLGVLRWRSLLDDKISQASTQPLKKLDLEILIALRLALYQFLFLDRIPHRAALHESVELVKRARKRSAAPFVNAVLRQLSKDPLCSSAIVIGGPLLADAGRNGDFDLSAKDLAAAYAHPEWLAARWITEFGLEATQKICQSNQAIPETTLRLRTPTAEAELASAAISLDPGKLLAQPRRVKSGDVTKTDSFRNAHAVIQDEASQLIAAIIGPGHKRILDCCAAPGGKTLAISDQNPGATITAVEIHPHRARLMQRLFPKQTAIQVVVADARHLPLVQPFDRILADVPCSGTGTLARNPEIKWHLKPEDMSDFQHRQREILQAALKHLRPGGRLIYSTCSLEKEENEDVVEQVLRDERALQLIDCSAELDRLKASGLLTWDDPASLIRGPYLRTIPGVHPCAGFFAAILART